MFRAITGLLFIVFALPLSALIASLTMDALGVSGLLGFLVGVPVFVGLLVAAVMLLAAINDRLNNSESYQKTHHGTHTHSTH